MDIVTDHQGIFGAGTQVGQYLFEESGGGFAGDDGLAVGGILKGPDEGAGIQMQTVIQLVVTVLADGNQRCPVVQQTKSLVQMFVGEFPAGIAD